MVARLRFLLCWGSWVSWTGAGFDGFVLFSFLGDRGLMQTGLGVGWNLGCCRFRGGFADLLVEVSLIDDVEGLGS